MSKRKAAQGRAPAPNAAASDQAPPDDQVIASSNFSLHELFQQQAAEMLSRADLSEEQKQEILVAMACPCCGAGAMSYAVKLKR
jgi:hypothetical protein